MPTDDSFSRLDHLLNDLAAAGVVEKAREQHFAFNFTNGVGISWNIDRVRKMIEGLPPFVQSRLGYQLSPGEVSEIVDGSVEVMARIDREYALSLPPSKLDDPIYAIKIPGDIGAPPECVGSMLVIDGNHRLYAIREKGGSARAVIVPEDVERECRDPGSLTRVLAT